MLQNNIKDGAQDWGIPNWNFEKFCVSLMPWRQTQACLSPDQLNGQFYDGNLQHDPHPTQNVL